MRVDAHHHVWGPEGADFPWTTGQMAPLARPYPLEDLLPELMACGIDRTVLVEASLTVEESPDLLALAATTDVVAGVVAWVDVPEPDAAEIVAWLRGLPGGRKLVGVRYSDLTSPDPDWLLGDAVTRGLGTLAGEGLVFDAMVRGRELVALHAAARRHPALRIVVDHLGKPALLPDVAAGWEEAMQQLASCPNVAVKLSGLVTIVPGEPWAVEDFRRSVECVLEWFGPSRVLLGSDWPVCLLGGSYEEVVGAYRACLDGLTVDERAAVEGATAAAIYGLVDGV